MEKGKIGEEAHPIRLFDTMGKIMKNIVYNMFQPIEMEINFEKYYAGKTPISFANLSIKVTVYLAESLLVQGPLTQDVIQN